MQDTKKTVEERQQKQSEQRSSRAHVREFNIGDSVVAKNYGSGPAWLPGKIVQKLGPLTYIVDVSDGRIWKRHVDHVKECPNTLSLPEVEPEIDIDIDFRPTASTFSETVRESKSERPVTAHNDDVHVTSSRCSSAKSVPRVSPSSNETAYSCTEQK